VAKAQTEGEEATTTEAVTAAKTRSRKPTLFNIDDTIMTPQGEATVVEVHGRGWVKVDGVPKAWHKIADLAELNPEAAQKLAVAEAELAAKKAAKVDGSLGKIAKLQARLEKAVARRDALNTTILELEAQIAGSEASADESAEAVE